MPAFMPVQEELTTEQELLVEDGGQTKSQGSRVKRSQVAAILVVIFATMGTSMWLRHHNQVQAKPADSVQLSYDLVGKYGPNAFDITQGQVANCYALAGLAAFAKTQPSVIKNAFVNPDLILGKVPVFSTKWYVGGEPMTIAVDEMLPAVGNGHESNLHFAQLSDKPREVYHLWPMILEKAFAKLNGAYFSTSMGQDAEVLVGLSGAPTVLHLYGFNGHDECVQDWDLFTQFGLMEYPVVFSVAREDAFVPTRHAYALLGTKIEILPDGTEKKVAIVYNPHGTNGAYKGKILGQQDLSGQFLMLYEEEFCHDVYKYAYSRVVPGYVVSHQSVKLHNGRAEAMYKFTITDNHAFTVMLKWIEPRIRKVRFNCSKPQAPVGAIMVRPPSGDPLPIIEIEDHEFSLTNSPTIDLRSAGEWEVYLFIAFKDAVLPKVALNVYAAEDVTFEPVDIATGNMCAQFENDQHKKACANDFKAFNEVAVSQVEPKRCNLKALQGAQEFLDNAKQIQKDGYDKNFPPDLSSLSQDDQAGCLGDAAAGQGLASCEGFNHWKPIREVMKARDEHLSDRIV